MKINALIIAFLMTLAGCSASVHGDVQGVNNPESNGRFVASHTASDQTVNK
jgi:starvation-inducible outer membrane lipoprotein